ncbi:MAG TPA: SelB C-terminal domain-containing protein, partial [Longimicrobiales bacterium]|nr:SelB C-terminal domain-containing protein [Longimicrobiales bacterium]
VVALTKVDLVEPEWLALVRDEVRELLADTPVAGAPIVATSARTGTGLEALGHALAKVAGETPEDDATDLARLPVDRVFTVHGTGTVVTGTLWSGTLQVGQRIAILPGGPEARIRGLQVHGRDVDSVPAGRRAAVALAGPGVDRATLDRGHTVVADPGWPATTMLTAHLSLLPDTTWVVEHNQRVRIHLGTAEVMARVVLLKGNGPVVPGSGAWVQLRLEAPVIARARERLVVRSYSPVTTIGGATVAEPVPPKRTRLGRADEIRLEALLAGDAEEAVAAALDLAGWPGVEGRLLPLVTGRSPDGVAGVLGQPHGSSPPAGTSAGTATADGERAMALGDAWIAPGIRRSAVTRLEEAVDEYHRRHPLRPGIPVEALRSSLPADAHPALADTVLEDLAEQGRVRVRSGIVSRPDFRPRPDARQERVLQRVETVYREAGLTPPNVGELPGELRDDPDLWPLLKLLSDRGDLEPLTDDLFVWAETLAGASRRVRELLGGQTSLGPADFREALPVTRKHLMPLLAYLDRVGVTVRRQEGREVSLQDPPRRRTGARTGNPGGGSGIS